MSKILQWFVSNTVFPLAEPSAPFYSDAINNRWRLYIQSRVFACFQAHFASQNDATGSSRLMTWVQLVAKVLNGRLKLQWARYVSHLLEPFYSEKLHFRGRLKNIL